MKRVVITGIGMVSPIGNNVIDSWANVVQGKSGIKTYINDPILKNNNPYNLALVKDFDYAKWKVPHASSRMNSFLASSCEQALINSQLDIMSLDPETVGVCLGCMASNNTKINQYIGESSASSFTNINRLSMLQILTNIPVATLNVKYKLKGPSLTVSTACASGLSSVVEGYKWIKYGQISTAIVGGVEDVYNPLCLNSSVRLQAMSTKVYNRAQQSSRPFDKQRSGFILGQGCGILILEEYEAAKKRKANIIAQILGYGYTSDGFHLVRPQNSGNGQYRAMKNALTMANISSKEIDLFNAHATSTLAGDQIQAKSIQSLNPSQDSVVTAFKSYIGHTFGAAGSIQLIFGIQCLKDSMIPKIMNLEESQVEGIKYARQNLVRPIKKMLKNSFGFGGINVSMVVGKV